MSYSSARKTLTPAHLQATIERMIRVNQAGEFGAVQIYKGQLSVIKDPSARDLIAHMASQESNHKEIFDTLLVKHKVRPTLLSPLWSVLGYGLGAITARLGVEGAMACTVAVEEAIDEHYQDQLKTIEHSPHPFPPKLQEAILKCHQEELEHRDVGLSQGAESLPGYPILSKAIKTGARLAIWLSSRI